MKTKWILIVPLILPTCTSAAEQNVAAVAEPITANKILSQADLIAAIVAANPQIEIVRAVWQASEARIKQQSAWHDPILSYQFAPQTIDNKHSDFGQRFEISQHLPWPGKLALQADAAALSAKADQENINHVRLQLTAIGKQLYSDWFFIHQALKINTETEQLLRQVKAIAKTRYQVGKSIRQEMLQADLEYNLLKHQQLILQRQQSEIQAQLNRLLNRPLETPLATPSALPKPTDIAALQQLQNIVLQQHPQLKAQTADIAALKLKQQRTRLESYPDFTVRASYNSLWDNPDKRFSIGISINVPLDQSSRRAAEDEVSARVKQAQWQKTDQMQELAEQVQIYFSRIEEKRHTLHLFQQQLLPLAKLNLQAAQNDYQSGFGDFLILLNAEKDWFKTRLQAQRVLADYHRSLAMLELAVGINDLSKIGLQP